MAKVLISFVGTGKFQTHDMTATRDYQKTNYRLDGLDIGEFPFMAAGLMQHHHVDKVILIGTAHSMWEEVYRYFTELHGNVITDDTYWDTYRELADSCERATAKSPLDIPHKDEVEQAVGNAHVVITRYGLDTKEIDENSNIILGIQQYLSNGDEVMVDITHSFRSLPIMIMNLLIYMQNVSRKNITITHIYYGMLEMFNENKKASATGEGFAPIIDLKNILTLNEWIIGAYSFSQYGNAYKISELLKGIDNDTSSRLKSFSDEMNLNHLDAIEDEAGKLSSLKNKTYDSLLPEMIVKPVVADFLKEFGAVKNNHALFQYRLAKWHCEHMNYALSLICLQESIITYFCQQKGDGKDWKSKDKRDEVKKMNKTCFETDYNKITRLRNCVAHSKEIEKNARTMIRELQETLKHVGQVISDVEKKTI